MLSTLFFPLVPWLLQLILFAWFVAVMVYLVTSGTAEYKKIENSTITDTACDAAVRFFWSNFEFFFNHIFSEITFSKTGHAF